MNKLKSLFCNFFGHKMIQVSDVERVCDRCKHHEKRLKVYLKTGKFVKADKYTQYQIDHNYSDWKPYDFIDNMAEKGDKVRLSFMKPGSSYWIVKNSDVDKIEFVHPVTEEEISIKQNPEIYQILST
jgi:hypothetical protein